MAGILLPLFEMMLVLGGTIDIRRYSLGHIPHAPIYNSTDYVETRLDSLNSNYYVLPDANIPYSALTLPIDMAISIRINQYSSYRQTLYNVVNSQVFDSAAVLFVTEYRALERSLKANASLLPDWQNQTHINQTHYADKMIYGSKCVALATIQSNVTGDVQIFRKILKDVMGAEGSIGEGTADLWNKAMKTMKESPEVRGYLKVGLSVVASSVDIGFLGNDVATLLKKLNEFLKHVKPPSSTVQMPMYTSFKPLSSLDKRYVSVEKDSETEKYMAKLDNMAKDLEYAWSSRRYISRGKTDYTREKFDSFIKKTQSAREPTRKLIYSKLSLYKKIDFRAFKNAFTKYQQGLDNTTENYFTAFKKVKEDTGVSCENIFLKPVSGYLRVQDNEIVEQGKMEGGLKECQDLCFEEKRCRAVGYAEQNKQCLIFYRSTYSASIAAPPRRMFDMRTYDRKCK